MKTALVLVFSDLKHDARVIRQIGFLSKEFQVTVAAYGNYKDNHHTFSQIIPEKLSFFLKLQIAFWSLLGRYQKSWSTFHPAQALLKTVGNQKWDLIIANDVDTLPAAFLIKGNANSKMVLDAHEYSPKQFENLLWWRLFFQPALQWICKNYIHRVDLVFTVGKGVRDEYSRNFKCSPIVITNAPPKKELIPSEVMPNKIRLVHHGIANPSRRPELMFELMKYLDHRFELDLYLLTSGYASSRTKNYIKQLKEIFLTDRRIRVLDPLPQDKIISTIHQYDVGIFLLPPINFNYENALPNKFFDFIQARLAVAIGPSPEMVYYLNQFQNGIVADDFEPLSLAKKLNSLTHDQLAQMKKNSNEAAIQLCSEENAVIFRQAINQLF